MDGGDPRLDFSLLSGSVSRSWLLYLFHLDYGYQSYW